MFTYLLLFGIIANGVLIKSGSCTDEITKKCDKCNQAQCTKPNEVFDPCFSSCSPQTCESIGKKYNCPLQPVPGSKSCKAACKCKPGYFRNKLGDCISKENCLKCSGPNEYFSCGGACDNVCSKLSNESQTNCKIINVKCNEMCYCDKDYARDEKGICIPISKCPGKCPGPNEFFGCGGACDNVCSKLTVENQTSCKIINEKCNYKCYCKSGFARDKNGICIPIKECPVSQCPVNEVYNECIQSDCSPKSCTDLGFPLSCPKIDPKDCKKGCICKEGYVRNENGKCIPSTECPSCGGDLNQVAGCGVYCNQRCRDVGKKPGPCILICYPNTCDCRKGFYLDENTGKCVLPKQCTPQCPINEVYNECIQGDCDPKSCTDLGFPLSCTKIDPKDCKKGCICKKGYVRNKNGTCIPSTECPSCGGDLNQVAGCGVYCNQRCRDVGKKPDLCILICYPNTCDCRKGFYLDENTGKCVLPKQCTPQCPINEVYNECIQGDCDPKSCTDLGFPLSCTKIDPKDCKKGCICKKGYVRNKNGTCIPSTECPSCGGDLNQVAGCGVYCNQRCRDVGKKPDLCILICYPNTCDCRKGFYLDENTGKCVLPKQCTPQCPGNEVYNECVQGDCGPKNCTDLGFPLSCPKVDPKDCKKGCICKQGYVRNGNGTCIPSTECPSCGGDRNQVAGCGVYCNQRCRDVGKKPGACILICYPNTCDCRKGFYLDENTGKCVLPKQCTPQCPINEVYNECIQGDCDPKSCTDLGFPLSCPKVDPKDCKKGCICKKGYVRNENGTCIPSTECPSCGGDLNQVAGCGVYCNQRCRDVGKKPGACILICYPNTCDCRKDFYLDENTGKCVLPKQCTPQCPVNEVYNECIQSDCDPKSCTDLGFPLSCPKVDPKDCKKGCICKKGYVRNENGTCIPSTECPSCGGDLNQVAGCGVYCNQRCRDVGKKPGTCILICNPNTCDCRKGFYLDENTGKCVLPKQCTPQCPGNEVYNECVQSDCGPKNCPDLGLPLSCPKIDPKDCKKGCICKQGYVRNGNGTCIPSTECPSCRGDTNQVSGCGVYCNQRCRDVGKKPGPCIRICYPNSCDCRQASCGGDTNQVAGCGVYCNQRCRDIGKKPGPCIRICYPNSCDCRKGFYLDENTGKCVLPQQCTPQCPGNEVYNECIQGDCSPKNCTDLGFPLSCPKIDPKDCKKGCICKQGYVRNGNGTCIPSTECPSCRGDPNQVSGCGVYCNQRCRDVGKKPGACILICYPNSCDCRQGFYLDENTGKCVLPKQCTPQCPVNQVYNEGIQGDCGPKNCTDLGFPLSCPKIDPKDCKKGCICKQGYVRNENGTCIPSTECPSCGGDLNQVAGCGVYCNQRCRDVGKKPGPCILICNPNTCDCRQGFYLDENTGKCVLPKQCTPQCPGNEVYNECIQGDCGPKSCTDLGFPLSCPKIDPKDCKKGCICKQGYVRNGNGTCIPSTECPSCGGDPNAQPGCGTNCNKLCSDVGQQSPSLCKLGCQLNGCDCKDGYYYDNKTKRCVKPEDCAPQCPVNEVECIKGDCGPKSCTDLGFPLSCPRIDPKYCIKGCICKQGYVRNENGTCIPSTECPSCGGDPNAQPGCGTNCNKLCSDVGQQSPSSCKPGCQLNGCDCKDGYYYDNKTKRCVKPEDCARCLKPNEVFDPCFSSCPPQTCESIGKIYDCPLQPVPGSKSCKAACKCKPGYFRNKLGDCISKDNCLKCSGPNEYFSCGGACDNVCSKLSNESQTNCKIINVKCNEMCYCDKDYARNETGICIPISECPGKCPGPNEFFGCGSACDNVCSKLTVENQTNCKIINEKCNYKCYCKSGFARDDNGICIPIKECPAQCPKPNEVFDPCFSTCPPQTCESIGKTYKCPLQPVPGSKSCKTACKCKPGYFRNKLGDCISKDNCLKCSGPNEYFSCGGACDNVCSKLSNESQTNCKIINVKCNEMCYCDKDYARNETGICIPISECPGKCPGPNEFFGCGSACDNVCSKLTVENQTTCKTNNKKCNYKCYCKSGCARNSNGICIPIKECPANYT